MLQCCKCNNPVKLVTSQSRARLAAYYGSHLAPNRCRRATQIFGLKQRLDRRNTTENRQLEQSDARSVSKPTSRQEAVNRSDILQRKDLSLVSVSWRLDGGLPSQRPFCSIKQSVEPGFQGLSVVESFHCFRISTVERLYKVTRA